MKEVIKQWDETRKKIDKLLDLELIILQLELEQDFPANE